MTLSWKRNPMASVLTLTVAWICIVIELFTGTLVGNWRRVDRDESPASYWFEMFVQVAFLVFISFVIFLNEAD
jgi:hypothetical protein